MVCDHPFADVFGHLVRAIKAYSELEIVTVCYISRIEPFALVYINEFLVYLNRGSYLIPHVAEQNHSVDKDQQT